MVYLPVPERAATWKPVASQWSSRETELPASSFAGCARLLPAAVAAVAGAAPFAAADATVLVFVAAEDLRLSLAIAAAVAVAEVWPVAAASAVALSCPKLAAIVLSASAHCCILV